ncbi:sec-independent translocase [Streptomyces sp. NPDC005438]|uniref:sec-independent translocase n=1 Tax=Streptomyces sp. NPDC005438 TaxID=3156880 RepID=UPI0033ADAF0B
MFFDIGPLELIALIILAVLIFGPDKLPKVIQDISQFIRKIRQFSDSAKEDIRSELGPEFKDFEFEDLNPKNFARKHLLDGDDDLGLKEIRESLDFRKDMDQIAGVSKDDEPDEKPARTSLTKSEEPDEKSAPTSLTKAGTSTPSLRKGDGSPSANGGRLTKSESAGAESTAARREPPPYDADAT